MRCWCVWLACLFGCVTTNTLECEDGRICPAGTACDQVHHGCVEPDQLKTCAMVNDGVDCVVGEATPGICRDQACLPAACGDGFQRGDELCDGTDLGMKTDCTQLQFYESGPLSCNSACSYDTSMCRGFCGDGRVSGPELCDGGPPQISCLDLGYGAGFLDCNMCAPDTTDCKFLDWQLFGSLQAMEDVHGTSDDDIFAAGGNLVLHFTHSSWSTVDLSTCVGASDDFAYHAVWALGNGEALVGGVDTPSGATIVLHTTAAGCTKLVVDASGMQVDDIWARAANDVYVVGSTAGIYHFDGTTWTHADSSQGLVRIWGSGPADIYAVGATTVRHFDGTTWSTLSVPGVLKYFAVWGTSAMDVYIAGSESTSIYVGGVAHYNGTNWTEIRSGLPREVKAGFTSGTHVFADDSGTVDVSDGSAWLDLLVPKRSTHVESMWVSPSGRLVEVSGFLPAIETYSGALMTNQAAAILNPGSQLLADNPGHAVAIGNAQIYDYNGSSWNADPGSPTGIGGMCLLTTGELLTVDNTGVSQRASFTWTSVAAVPGARIWGVSASDFWVAGGGGLEHWNGSAIDMTFALPANTNVTAMWGSASDVFAVTYDYGTFPYHGAVQHWNGSTWTASAPTAPLLAIGGSGPNDVYAVGNSGTIIHYDGTAWTPIAITGFDLSAVFALAPDDVFIGGSIGYAAHYDGTHWSPVRASQTAMTAIGGVGDTVLMVDDAGTVYRLIKTAPL